MLALFLLCLVRVGVIAEYGEAGFTLKIRVGPFAYLVYPKKPEEKPKREKEAQKAGDFERFRVQLKSLLDLYGSFLRGLKVDELAIDFTAAAEDPADAAMMYGLSAAGIGGILPVLEHNFVIKNKKIRVFVDFDAQKPLIKLKFAFSILVWRMFTGESRFIIALIRNNMPVNKHSKVV